MWAAPREPQPRQAKAQEQEGRGFGNKGLDIYLKKGVVTCRADFEEKKIKVIHSICISDSAHK